VEGSTVERWTSATDTLALDLRHIEARLGDLRELLQAATASPPSEPGGDGSFLLDLPARAFGRDLAKQVRVRTGIRHRAGHRVLLPIEWRAEPAGALFPTFEGTLELEELAPRLTELRLVGRVASPLGPLGGYLDAGALRRIGDATAERLVIDLIRALETAARSGSGAPAAGRRPGDVVVGDVMTPAPIVVTEDTPLRECVRTLSSGGVSGLPVLDDDGVLVGILSEADLLPRLAPDRGGIGRRANEEARRRDARTAGAACSRPPRCTAVDTPVVAAARELLDHDVARLVVLDGGQVAGIVTRHDVIRALVRADEDVAAAVDGVLRDRGADEVFVDVHAGEVRLEGEVELRTVAAELPTLIEAIPGVDRVDDTRLAWRVDDLVALTPTPLI
jgi:CBS domain-containing protein